MRGQNTCLSQDFISEWNPSLRSITGDELGSALKLETCPQTCRRYCAANTDGERVKIETFSACECLIARLEARPHASMTIYPEGETTHCLLQGLILHLITYTSCSLLSLQEIIG